MFITSVLLCLDAPSEPLHLEITKFDKSSVTLSWEAPTDENPVPRMCSPLTNAVMLHCKPQSLLRLYKGSSYCSEHICVSVCKYISETTRTIFTNSSTNVAIARLFCGGIPVCHVLLVFSARCNIYISRLCCDVTWCPSVCLSVCDGSALAHYS